MTSPDAIVMAGLPASGKSTYLAALFHALKEGGTDDARLRRLPEERDYILELERRWLALEPLARSSHGAPKRIELSVRLFGTTDVDVLIPDVTGEDFRHAWDTSEWSDDVATLFTGSRGLLLFIRADDVNTPDLIQVGLQSGNSEGHPQQWESRMGSTQAVLCDLLEQVREMRDGELPPVGVILSAWDTVDDGIEPAGWLEWKVPLVAQWLKATEPSPNYQLFPMSAQGGDLGNRDIRARLSRVSRLDRAGGAEALTAPLRWLMQQ